MNTARISAKDRALPGAAHDAVITEVAPFQFRAWCANVRAALDLGAVLASLQLHRPVMPPSGGRRACVFLGM
jgi:hypothetical protein